MSTPGGLPPRVYPLPPDGEEIRFTNGLIFDVAAVLTEHGYPELGPLDLVELGQAIFRFLYQTAA